MKQFIEKIIAENGFKAERLLTVLRAVQTEYYHIPNTAFDPICEQLKLPRSHIISVIEFYSFLHLNPRGRYDILFSDSITDQMLGKQNLIQYMADQLNLTIGEVRSDGLVSLDNTSCTGMCDQGPAALINGYALPCLTTERIDQIIKLIEQQIELSEWPAELFQVEDNIHKTGMLLDQTITPGEALNATFDRGLAETLSEMRHSKLRGRGGAGFDTSMKWQFCCNEIEQQRYVICNADEGEPGTFKDRVLLNSYADQVIEGMTVCAAIIGAKQGFIYLRAEYLHLHSALQTILDNRREKNLLGENICQQHIDFDIEICMGAGAYICGEESALIESLEGKRGIPRNRPPYPVTQGYKNKPTVVDNVETFMAAAKIAVIGGQAFAKTGTEKSTGTKLLSISGDCQTGIYEYPFGVTVQDILDDCQAENVLGVQIGGPSGSFISNQEFDRKIAFEDLATGGSFIVFNNSRNILDIVKNFTHFFAHESCGFCTPCRVGSSLLQKQLDKITDGHGSSGDVVELEQISQLLKNYSHCGLGQTAANPVLTTLQRYPELYQQQLKKISYEPGFDLDASLETARQMANRNDTNAHLTQVDQ